MKPSTLIIREVFKSSDKEERDKKLMKNIINIIQSEQTKIHDSNQHKERQKTKASSEC